MRRTIPRLLRDAAEDAPDTPWLFTSDERLTFAQARDRVERGASWLREAGIGPDARVVTTPSNTVDHLLCWLALMEVGAIQVPINPRSSVVEVTGFVAQVDPALVITDEARRATVVQAIAGAGTRTPQVDVDRMRDAAPDGRPPAEVDERDVAVMIPTSGTTGRSKLVMQTHLAYVMAGEGFPWWLGLTGDDRLMTSLPLFHINAPAYSILGSIVARAGLVLLEGFSASGFLDAARLHGATQFNAIGAMLELLARQPARPDDADHAIRLCYTGPSPQRDRHLELEARFGFEIRCGYALSETPYGLIWAPGTRPFGTLGSPRQHPELGHVNDARARDDDHEVGPGEVGELELANPAIMRGYYEMPEATREVLVDGWLRTGDLVQVNDDGTYTFVGRKKEVIRRRGENLSPTEVEAVLSRHPSVAEAAVVGVPSELSEEDVKAFVVPAEGGTVDIADLHTFAGRHLTQFKVPRYFEVVADLPHTATGRVAKHQLPRERTPDEVDLERGSDPDPTTSPSPDASADGGWLHTWIGSSDRDHITIAGRDLAGDVMGRLTLTELAYLLLTRREPTPAQRRILDAALVSLADHGLTPSALAARLTYTGAPEAIQGAVAAGLLGAGSVLLGPAGDTAEFLEASLRDHGGEPMGDEELARAADAAVAARRAGGGRIPGLGHPVHRHQDPRTPRLYELAAREGLLGVHLRLLELIAAANERASGRRLPINGAGAAGAALLDAGLPASSVRGFVLIGRTAGLVAHLAEEREHPLGMPLWLEVEERSRPRPPDDPGAAAS